MVVVDTIGLRCTSMDYCEHLWITMDIYGLFTMNIFGQMYFFIYGYPQTSTYLDNGAAQWLK